MRNVIVAISLMIALLGAIGLGSAHSLASVHPVAATHTHLLVDGTLTPLVQCGGSAPTFC